MNQNYLWENWVQSISYNQLKLQFIFSWLTFVKMVNSIMINGKMILKKSTQQINTRIVDNIDGVNLKFYSLEVKSWSSIPN